MNQFNTNQLYKTIKVLVLIFNKCQTQYWFMGSIIPTALNGRLYRKVNDFDILIDSKHISCVCQEVVRVGYKQAVKNIYRISEQLGLYSFIHTELLEVGFFSVTEENKVYSLKKGPVKIIMTKDKLIPPYKYTYQDIKFNGISPSIASALSNLSKDNPKRKIELEIFNRNKIQPAKWPLYDFIFFGFKMNWVIDVLSYFLVVLGKIRLMLGKNYDPWR